MKSLENIWCHTRAAMSYSTQSCLGGGACLTFMFFQNLLILTLITTAESSLNNDGLAEYSTKRVQSRRCDISSDGCGCNLSTGLCTRHLGLQDNEPLMIKCDRLMFSKRGQLTVIVAYISFDWLDLYHYFVWVYLLFSIQLVGSRIGWCFVWCGEGGNYGIIPSVLRGAFAETFKPNILCCVL